MRNSNLMWIMEVFVACRKKHVTIPQNCGFFNGLFTYLHKGIYRHYQ